MKFHHIIAKTAIILTAALFFALPISAMDDPGFTINRMVMCEKISDLEPNDITDTFSIDVESVYCFLETQNIELDTTINFVWYFEGQEKARVQLPLQKGPRWRTFSSKKVANMKGNWKVELQENSGIVLNTVSFEVQ